MVTSEILKVSNLTKTFGGIKAVNDVSFHVNKGEITALIGTNGAGKTTCFNLITGFDKPNRGKVIFDGINLSNYVPSKISALGFVRTFQHTNIFGSMTVLDNLLVGQHLDFKSAFKKNFFKFTSKSTNKSKGRERAIELLELVGMQNEHDKMAANLSYGSQKVLGLLMALACKPKLLALDEPAAGLNSVETGILTKLIRKINNEGVSVLVVEHDMKFIMDISSRIFVMAEGKKIAEGTPQEIRNNETVQNIYFGNLKKEIANA
jgi:branched-chain amino acid transport system ATP-binding protein